MFREYLESNNNPTVTNYMNPITHACIAIRLTGNIQGTQKVFGIYTDKLLNRRRIITMNMPYHMINRLNDRGKRSQQ